MTMQQPDAVVYEVNHCAYALLRKGPAAASPEGQQKVCLVICVCASVRLCR